MGFWKKLMGRRLADETETPEEKRLATEGVGGIAADEFVEQLGGDDPNRLVDDEFKP